MAASKTVTVDANGTIAVTDYFNAIRIMAENPYVTADLEFIENQRLKYEVETDKVIDRHTIIQNCILMVQEALSDINMNLSRKGIETAFTLFTDRYLDHFNLAARTCHEVNFECEQLEKLAKRLVVGASGDSIHGEVNFVRSRRDIPSLLAHPRYAAIARTVASAVSAGQILDDSKAEVMMLGDAIETYCEWVGTDDYDNVLNAYERVRDASNIASVTVPAATAKVRLVP